MLGNPLAMRCDEVLELAIDRDSGQHVLMMFPGSVVKTLLHQLITPSFL